MPKPLNFIQSQSFRQSWPAIISMISLMATSFLFQNCAQYSADSSLTDTDNSSTSTTCAPTDFTCSDLNNVQLVIANQDPLQVRSSPGPSNGTCDASTCVDVSGYCDVDGFSSNKISASISGSANLPETVLSSCDSNGRFRLLLPMPNGFVINTTYTVTVILKIYDASGASYENPSGLNRKTITLTSTP